MLNISEVNFDEIKDNLKEYFSQRDEFKDYNFEGSGLSLLMDVLAYTIHYLSYYLNISATEAFLDSAILRKNINSIAKTLNYLPKRISGSESIIDINLKSEYIPEDTSTIITIPKFTKFSSKGYNFYTKQSYNLTSANSYTFEDIILRQGIIRQDTFISNGQTDQEIIITNESIDNSTFEVYVDSVLWELENDLTSIDETSTTYSIELTDDNYVKVLFGDNILGMAPSINSEILVIYGETVGIDANNLSFFNLNQVIEDNFSNTYDDSYFDITTVQQSLGGSDYETDDSIKVNAPKFYATQNRLVTKDDYTAFLNKHEIVEDSNVWGGDEINDFPKYGTVYIAVKPYLSINLTEFQKTTLYSYLEDKNILTINIEFVDISYFYVDITGTIYFLQRYESTLNSVKSKVETTIQTFFDDIDNFENIFKFARLISTLINLDEIGNVNLTINPFFYFNKVLTGNYFFVLNNEILENSIDCDIISGNLNEGFYDDGNGNIITKKDNSTIIGEIDYAGGSIEIFIGYEITITEPENGYKVYFDTTTNDITYKRQRTILNGTNSLTYTRYI